jgi:hypothetical protein
MSSSESESRALSLSNGSSRTAGKPAGSMLAMSAPLALMQIASTPSPRRSRTRSFTEVLPPPCSTSLGSLPSRRAL